MKTLTSALFLFLFYFTTFSQKQTTIQAWQHPILKQLQNKAPNLVQLNHKIDADYYVPIAILNKQNNLLYYVTTFGLMFDSVVIGPKLAKALITKQIDAFETYNKILTTEELKELGTIRNLLRENGLGVDKKIPNSNYINYTFFKTLNTTLEKTITLDEYEKTALYNNMLLNLVIKDRTDQDFLNKKNRFESYKPAKLKTHQTKPYDYFEYTNQNRFTKIPKATFYPNTGVVYVYNNTDKLVDSFTVKKDKAKELTDEKQDIFALYRLWLEWQIQTITEQTNELLKQSTNKKTGNTFSNEQQLQLNNLANYYNHLQQKVLYAILPEKDLLLANVLNQANTYSRKKWVNDSGG